LKRGVSESILLLMLPQSDRGPRVAYSDVVSVHSNYGRTGHLASASRKITPLRSVRVIANHERAAAVAEQEETVV
jgi:hypothetical protein